MTVIKPLEDFRSSYESHSPVLLRFACRYVSRAEAEDIVQDVYADVWQRGKLKDIRSIGYLMTAVRNRCINHLEHERMARSHHEKIKDDTLKTNGGEPTPAERQADDLRLLRIYDIIDQMPEQRRRIVRMAYIDDRSNADIASELNLTVNTVKHHLWLGLQEIRRKVS